MVSPNFSIIIPNYNGADFLSNCLNSLYQSIKNCPNSKFEIIIVDNGSKDNSLSKIKEFENSLKIKKCKLKIIQNFKNLGFSKAVNRGIVNAKYDWVVICNNDLTLDKNWFRKIAKVIGNNKDKKNAVFFGTVLNKSGTRIESQGLKFYYSGKAENINNGKLFSKPSQLTIPRPVKGGARGGFLIWGASASLIVYNKKVIKKVGLFDEDFFAYEEDVDLSLRLHNFGYKTTFIPYIFSYHLGGGTSCKMGNCRNYMDAKNWVFVIIKNFSLKQILFNFPKIIEERLRNLSCLIKNTPRKLILKTIINLKCEIILSLPKTLKKRFQIRKMLKLANQHDYRH